ncbi:hypothetical protein ACKF11_13545 [Methylobacillus sp. Pita2]|uniref:hypothetical protein n=1 Tax=Methylobacillus sp. Pita2 TaxID=3383245 RepID=UPI0038B4C76C
MSMDHKIQELLASLEQQGQRQDGAKDQLLDLIPLANRLGLQDAADVLKLLTGKHDTQVLVDEETSFKNWYAQSCYQQETFHRRTMYQGPAKAAWKARAAIDTERSKLLVGKVMNLVETASPGYFSQTHGGGTSNRKVVAYSVAALLADHLGVPRPPQ